MTDELSSADVVRAVTAVRDALTDERTVSVVVVGDVMLDRYVDGTSTRLSPEAPVPVVDVSAEHDRLGGAANVAVGLAQLGLHVILIGVIGDDAGGERVRSLLAESPGIDARLLIDATRMTTTKERVRVDGRHVIRIDREVVDPPGATLRGEIERTTQGALAGAAVLVVSDYAKGTVSADLLEQLVDRPCTIVDPKHPDVERYRGASLLAPNRAEAIAAASEGATPSSLAESVQHLHGRLPGTALVVTCGADGIVWSDRGSEGLPDLRHMASLARHVDDVTGAGDSVVCGLAAALATGSELPAAIAMASALAAVAVESLGTATPTWAEVDALVVATTP